MFFENQFTFAFLAIFGLLVLYSIFINAKRNSSQTALSVIAPDIQEPLVDPKMDEDALLPAHLGKVEAMLLAIASGTNVNDAARAYGFTEDEARVALTCYEL